MYPIEFQDGKAREYVHTISLHFLEGSFAAATRQLAKLGRSLVSQTVKRQTVSCADRTRTPWSPARVQYTRLYLEVNQRHHDGECSYQLEVWGERPMTKDELAGEQNRAQESKKRAEEYERGQLRALKAKYESGDKITK